MGTGYVRQSSSSITDGATIQASHFNDEYDQLESAFNATTGHSHDGTTGEGPLIILSGAGVGITGTLAVGNGGVGVTTLTDGGILLGSGTSAVTATAVLGDGFMVIGDNSTDPILSQVLTASAGFVRHEFGGIEIDISAVTTDNFLIGTNSGVIGVRTAAQARAHISLEIGTDVQAQSAHLDDLNSLGAVSGSGLLMQSDGAGSWAYVTASGAFQSQDDHLDDLAALSTVSGADTLMVSTGAGAWALESGATMRTSLGLAIGTDVQAFDVVLDDLAALSAVADNEFIVGTGAGAYAHESGATVRTSLGLAIGTDVQAFDAVLDDLAALSAVADNEFIVGTGAGTYAHESGTTLRTSMGLGTGDSPQFTAVNVGAASDTTITRTAAGVIAVEGNDVSMLVLGTEQASTSGTAITFGSLPSWVKRITILLVGVSTDGTGDLIVRLGDSGGIESTAYENGQAKLTNGTVIVSGPQGTSWAIAFGITSGELVDAQVTISLEDASNNTWVYSSIGGYSTVTDTVSLGSGSKSLSGTLTQVQITTTSGDTFDAGGINILYE